MSPPSHTIALVDDDATLRDALTNLLRAYGLNTRAYATAEAFLAADDGDDIDCAVLDVHLGPGMSGLELGRVIATSARPVPVIIITGAADVAARNAASRARCVAFLEKPFEADRLVAAILASIP